MKCSVIVIVKSYRAIVISYAHIRVSLKSTSPFYGTVKCGIISADKNLAVRNGGCCLKYLFEYIVFSGRV